MNWKTLVVVFALLVAAGIIFVLVQSTDNSVEEAQVTPPKAVEAPIEGKDVNVQVLVAKRMMRPSEVTVERGDRVFVYATAIDSGITVFNPSTNEEIPLARNESHVFVFLASGENTLACTMGCDEGVTFTIRS